MLLSGRCKGNEEMVPFAYRLYQRYLAGEVEDFTAQQVACYDDDCASAHTDGANPMMEDNEEGDHSPHGHNFELAHNEITAFSNTFCRKERVTCMSEGKEVTEERNIKVYFLGIWDCVNSVAPLERRTPVPVPVKGTARYVRHAVAVDGESAGAFYFPLRQVSDLIAPACPRNMSRTLAIFIDY